MSKHFKYMTLDDEMLIAEASTRVEFEEGELLLRRGDPNQAIIVINDGVVRIEIDQVVIALKGPGALIGEMSFIRNSGASADVLADSPVTADRIDGYLLNTLLFSVPGLATRFYASLADVLAQRLEEQINWASQVPNSVRMPQFHALEPTPPHREPDTKALLEAEVLQRDYLDWRARPGVKGADALFHRTLASITLDEPGIGRMVEESGLLRLSPFHRMASRQQRGFCADYDTLRALHAEPDDEQAQRIQRLLLGLPALAALQQRGQAMAETIAAQLDNWQGELPLPLLFIGCSSNAELEALYSTLATYTGALTLSVVEPDPRALQELNSRWAPSSRPDWRLQCILSTPLQLPDGDQSFLGAQQVVLVPALADFIDDQALLAWLTWTLAKLLPGGSLILHHLNACAEGFSYLRHALAWPLQQRSRADLNQLLMQLPQLERFSIDWSERADRGAWLITIRV